MAGRRLTYEEREEIALACGRHLCCYVRLDARVVTRVRATADNWPSASIKRARRARSPRELGMLPTARRAGRQYRYWTATRCAVMGRMVRVMISRCAGSSR